MAKFTITSLNYIAYGSDRTMVNMDVDRYNAADLVYVLRQEDQPIAGEPISGDVLLEQGPGKYYARDFISKEFSHRPSLAHALSKEEKMDDIILNEQFSYFEESDPDVKAYVRLYLDSSRYGLHDELVEFNKGKHMVNQTFELENVQRNEEQNQIYSGRVVKSMYDMNDVAVKSRNPSRNYGIVKFDLSADMTEDIYLPNVKNTALGFCQVDSDSYLLTDKTTAAPAYVHSSLNYDTTVLNNTQFQHLMLTSDQVKTYIYTPLSAYGTATYYDHFLSSPSDINTFFTPKANLENVEYNYIAQIPLAGSNSLTTDYENGNVYGYLMTAKNMYGSTYSMDMESLKGLLNCREYIGIGKSAGQPYLTYYDSRDYVRNSEPTIGDYTADVALSASSRESYPYQKVETFHPISFTDSTLHKPTMFSVRLNDTGLDPADDQFAYEENDQQTADRIVNLRKNIRQDITNAIREIARNVSPVQTQLFDVEFKG